MRNTMRGCLILLALLAGSSAALAEAKPNILVIMGDDIGYWNVGYNNRGMMGYATPHIDRSQKPASFNLDEVMRQLEAEPRS